MISTSFPWLSLSSGSLGASSSCQSFFLNFGFSFSHADSQAHRNVTVVRLDMLIIPQLTWRVSFSFKTNESKVLRKREREREALKEVTCDDAASGGIDN